MWAAPLLDKVVLSFEAGKEQAREQHSFTVSASVPPGFPRGQTASISYINLLL